MTNFINIASTLTAAESAAEASNTESVIGIIAFVVIVVISIGSWLLAQKFRGDYGTEEMSRVRGFGLILGLTVVLVGTVMMIESVTTDAVRAPVEYMKGSALAIVGGTGLCVLCCMGILKRYTGMQAVGMILRLFVVGLAIYLLISWIAVGITMWIGWKLFRACTRRRYVVIEAD